MAPSLFKLTLLALLLVAGRAGAPGTPPHNDLVLNISITTSEHSRDSNSEITSLRVLGDMLVYEHIYHGAHSARHQPVAKEFKLTNDDRTALLRSLKEKNLLRTKTIMKSADQRVTHDFALSIRTKVSGRQNTIAISAPRSAVELKNDPLYRASISFLTELYKIIQRTDPDITLHDLID